MGVRWVWSYKAINSLARQNLAKVIRSFDLVALQQIASVERDLIPRLVDAINHGETRYEYVISEPTGPKDRPEQLAFIFDTSRLRVDRRQTYTIEDPTDRLTYDPLVACSARASGKSCLDFFISECAD